MTLVARAKPPSHHKKVSGKHHRASKSYHKPYWPYLPLVGIVIVGFLLGNALPGKRSVLGYATDMSVQSLLDDTNAQRAANSETSLTLNAQLDAAAQAKANDMAAKDYWSHNTPDGQTPWSFVTAAGYDYKLAGENLAYGFATASDTLTGWMNSPEHRANILNAGYQEVGFGFINITDYQNSGPETLVVAMYAAPATTAAASAPAPVSGSTAASSPGAATPKPAAQTVPASQTTAATQPTNGDTLTPAKDNSVKAATVAEPKAQKVGRVQILTAGKAPWSTVALSLAGTIALLIFLLRHGFAWHKVLVRGERFVLNHRWLDMAIVTLIVAGFILTRASGVIR